MPTNFKFLLIAVTLILSPYIAESTAFARTINHDLKTQFEKDTDRVLPKGEHYTLGIDGYLFHNPPDDFYHSGYWYNLFGELRYIPRITLNLKLAIYDPGISYGTASSIQVQPFINISADHYYKPLDMLIKLRAGDLERQTIANGLTFEDLEMNGVLLSLEKGPFLLNLLKNGTGGYVHCADINEVDLSILDGIMGMYYMTTTVDSTCKTEDPSNINHSFSGVFSRYQFKSGFGYALEASQRHGNRAGLASFVYEALDHDILSARIQYQYRQYENGYAEGYIGRIYQDYISVEQRDKSYTNSMNIFIIDDNVKVHAGQTHLHLFKKRFIRAFSKNEFGAFDFINSYFKRIYYFHHAVELCPNEGRDDCLSFGYANKITNTRQSTRVNGSEGSEPNFRSIRHWRVEAKFRL